MAVTWGQVVGLWFLAEKVLKMTMFHWQTWASNSCSLCNMLCGLHFSWFRTKTREYCLTTNISTYILYLYGFVTGYWVGVWKHGFHWWSQTCYILCGIVGLYWLVLGMQSLYLHIVVSSMCVSVLVDKRPCVLFRMFTHLNDSYRGCRIPVPVQQPTGEYAWTSLKLVPSHYSWKWSISMNNG